MPSQAAPNAIHWHLYEGVSALVWGPEDLVPFVYDIVKNAWSCTAEFSEDRALSKKQSNPAATRALECSWYVLR
jgi:hypothetical protein